MFFKKKCDIEIKIEGMGCPKCSEKVENALNKIDGITTAKVDLKKGVAYVNCENGAEIDDKKLKDVIIELGYQVTNIKR